MTYPPQQPDPYGQQQPHNQPLPGGYYQPQQPAQYPQGGYYQQQPGQFGAPQPPPNKKRTGLIIGVIAAVVVVLGGGATAAYFLYFRDAGQADPETVGRSVVDALNKKDEAAVLALTCDEYKATLKKALDRPDSMVGSAASLNFTYQSVQANGDMATVKMHYDGTVSGKQGAKDDTIALRRDAASGKWSVCPQKKN